MLTFFIWHETSPLYLVFIPFILFSVLIALQALQSLIVFILVYKDDESDDDCKNFIQLQCMPGTRSNFSRSGRFWYIWPWRSFFSGNPPRCPMKSCLASRSWGFSYYAISFTRSIIFKITSMLPLASPEPNNRVTWIWKISQLPFERIQNPFKGWFLIKASSISRRSQNIYKNSIRPTTSLIL